MGGGRVGMSTTANSIQNKVIHGDCLEVMPTLPDKSIDMILCDLPYGTTACKWDTIIPFEPLWKEYKRLIKDNRAIVLFGQEPFSSFLRISNLVDYKYDWKWDKKNGGNPFLVKQRPLIDYEDIVIFNAKSVYNPIIDVKNNYNKIPEGNSRCEKSDHFGEYRWNNRRNVGYPRAIIKGFVDAPRKKIHPTQKPVALFEYLIKTYTNEGETVLDNCAGSGTTAIACLNTNRKYILIEQEQKYIDIINKRISEHEIQVAIC